MLKTIYEDSSPRKDGCSMDKITSISNSSPVPEPRKAENPGSDLFKQSLDAAQAKKTAVSGSTQAVKSLGEVAATPPPQLQSLSPAVVIQKTDRLLDLLDIYSKDIDNPGKTLKDLEPLIDTIKKDASLLLAEADKALPGDGDLKRIAKEAAVAANVEYFKFYRGDYI
jgi:hypothetical protein